MCVDLPKGLRGNRMTRIQMEIILELAEILADRSLGGELR